VTTTARRVMPLVAVAAALLAIGLAIAAFLRRPSAGASRRDRDAWAKAYHAARGCLLGAPPASGDAGEALTAADLAAPNRTCGPELVALAALGGDDAGGGWTELRLALGRLADAFIGRDDHTLGAGFDVDAARADAERLSRVVAEVEAAAAAVRPDVTAAAPARPTLEPLALTPLEILGGQVTYTSLWRGVMWVTVGDDQAYYQVRWNAGRPLPLPMGSVGVESLWSPAGTWQTWIDHDGRGAVMAATDTGAHEATVASTSGVAQVLGLAGEDHRRLIVYRDDAGGWLARSADNGRRWSKVRLPFDAISVSAAVARSGDAIELVWSDDATHRLRLDLDAATGPVPDETAIGDTALWSDCGTGGALWVVLHDEDTERYVVRRADTDRDLLDLREDPTLEACSAQAALVTVGPRQLLCTASGCKPVPTIDRFATSVVTGETLIRIAEDREVVAIWRGDAPPAFYKLPAHRSFRGAIDSGDHAILIFVRDGEAVEYAAIEP
jgi:hypothetical protein